MPSATSCVNSTVTSSKPAASRPALVLALRERTGDAADVAAALGTVLGRQSWSSATMSLTPTRPPGLEHARDLRQHGRLVGGEVDHAVRDDDVDAVGRAAGSASITPLRKWTFATPASPRSAARARASRRSCRARTPMPVGPTRLAERITSMPPPEPRSSTRLARVQLCDGDAGCRSRAMRARPRLAAGPVARRYTGTRRTPHSLRSSSRAPTAARAPAHGERRLGVAPPDLLAQLVRAGGGAGHRQHAPFVRSATAATRSNASALIAK